MKSKGNIPALVVLCLSAFLVPFMGSALNLALPQISEDFSMKAIELGWMATAYLISTAIFQVPFARLADLLGRKKMFISGVVLFSICTFLCGLSTSGIQLISLRFLSGLGSAMMFGTNIAILTSIFPKNERGKVLGINTSVVYFALASGPFFGGMLTHQWGWKSLFYVCAAIGLVIVISSFYFLKGEWTESKGEKFDYIGAFIYGTGLFGIIWGFSALPRLDGFLWVGVGIAAFIFFVYFERRSSYPVFNVRIFSGNKIFSLSSLSALINYAAVSAVAFMMSLYLQYIRGFDAQHAGLILIVQACIQSVVSLFAGRLSDRISASWLATVGMGITVLGLGGLFFLTVTTPLYILVILLALLGFGFGLFSSPNTNVIMSSVDKKYYGQASATTGTMRLTGQSISMGIAMMAISLQVGNQLITPEIYPLFMKSLHITFGICVMLCLFGVYASSFRIRTRDRQDGM